MPHYTWLNEPAAHHAPDESSLTVTVTGRTDFWRRTHYGFTVHDGPFAYRTFGGEFAASAKITADYRAQFDQLGLMLRVDSAHWIKAGVEYVDGRANVSAVVTDGNSDWSVVALDVLPEAVWIRATRRGDAVRVDYSLDGADYRMLRLAPLPPDCAVQVGPYAAAPDGDGFTAEFAELAVRHLPDAGTHPSWRERQDG